MACTPRKNDTKINPGVSQIIHQLIFYLILYPLLFTFRLASRHLYIQLTGITIPQLEHSSIPLLLSAFVTRRTHYRKIILNAVPGLEHEYNATPEYGEESLHKSVDTDTQRVSLSDKSGCLTYSPDAQEKERQIALDEWTACLINTSQQLLDVSTSQKENTSDTYTHTSSFPFDSHSFPSYSSPPPPPPPTSPRTRPQFSPNHTESIITISLGAHTLTISSVRYISKRAMMTTTTPALITAMRISYELIPTSSVHMEDRHTVIGRTMTARPQNCETKPSVSACVSQLRCARSRRPPSATTTKKTIRCKEGASVAILPSSGSGVVDIASPLAVGPYTQKEKDDGMRIISKVTDEEEKEGDPSSQVKIDDALRLRMYSPLLNLPDPPNPRISLDDDDDDDDVPEMQGLHKTSCESSSPVAQEEVQLGERAGDGKDVIVSPRLRLGDMFPSLDLEFLVSHPPNLTSSSSDNNLHLSSPGSSLLPLQHGLIKEQLTADKLCSSLLPSPSSSSSLYSDSGWFTPYDGIGSEHEYAQQINSSLTASNSSSSTSSPNFDLGSFHSAPLSLFEASREEEEVEEEMEEERRKVKEEGEGGKRLVVSAKPTAAYTLSLGTDVKALIMSKHVVKTMLESIPGLETIAEMQEDEYEDGSGDSSQSVDGGIDVLDVPSKDGNVIERQPMAAEVSLRAIEAASSGRISFSTALFDGKELIEDDDEPVRIAMDDGHQPAQPEGEKDQEHGSRQLKSSSPSFSSMSSSRTLTALLTPGGNQRAQTPTPDHQKGGHGHIDNATGVQGLSLGAPAIWSSTGFKIWQSAALTCTAKESRSCSSSSSPSLSEAVALAAMEEALDGVELDYITRAVRDAQQHEVRCLLNVHFEFGAHRWCSLSDNGTEVLSSVAILIQDKEREQARYADDPLTPLCAILAAIKEGVPVPAVFQRVISETERSDRQGLPFWFNASQDPIVRMTLQPPRARSQALNRPWPSLALGSDARAGAAATPPNVGPGRSPLVARLKENAAEFSNHIGAPVHARQSHPPAAYPANANALAPTGLGARAVNRYRHSAPGFSDAHLAANKSDVAPVQQASIYQARQQPYPVINPPQHMVPAPTVQPASQSFPPISCRECVNSAGATWHSRSNVPIFPALNHLPVYYTFYPVCQPLALPQTAPVVTPSCYPMIPNAGILIVFSTLVSSAVPCAPVPGQGLSSHLNMTTKSKLPSNEKEEMCSSLKPEKAGAVQCADNEDIPAASIPSCTNTPEQDSATPVVPKLDNPPVTLLEEQLPSSLECVPTSRSRQSSATGPDLILDDLASSLSLTTMQPLEDKYSQDVEAALYSCACATSDLDLLDPQPPKPESSVLAHTQNLDQHSSLLESTYGTSSLASLSDQHYLSGTSLAGLVSSSESCTLESSRAGLKSLSPTFVSPNLSSVYLDSPSVCLEFSSLSCLLESDSSGEIVSSSPICASQDRLAIASSSLLDVARASQAEAVELAGSPIQDFENYDELALNSTSISLDAEPGLFEGYHSHAMIYLPQSSEAPHTCPAAIFVNLPARGSEAEAEDDEEELDSIPSYSSISLAVSSPEEFGSGVVVTNILGTTMMESATLEEMSPLLPSLDCTSLIDGDISLYNMSWRHSISFLEAFAPSSQGSSGTASRAVLVSPLGWIGLGVSVDVCAMDDGERSRLEEMELELGNVD